MTEVNGAQLVARQLKFAGIDTIFTVLAGPMIEVLAASAAEGIKVVNCRHEMNAAFAASSWGYLNDKAGVVVVGSGPAMTNTVTPMYVATESSMPLLVLGGSAAEGQLGLGGFQETNQVSFAESATKWAQRVDRTARIPELVHLALGRAISGRPGAVYLDFPGNLISGRIDEADVRMRESAPVIAQPTGDPAAIEEIAEMLATAQRPLVMIGKGAAWSGAGARLEQLVGRGIPFIASPMGRGTVPDDDAMSMAAARSTAMEGADAVLMVGARFNWMYQFGRRLPEGVRIAQIDIEAEEMYSASNVEIGVVADCNVATGQLNEALEGRTLAVASSGWAESLREQCTKSEAGLGEQMSSSQQPINHYRLLADVRDALDRDAVVVEEGELTMAVSRQVMPTHVGKHRFGAGTTGCMGVGFPYAVGAKLAKPDTQVVAVLGDYAFGAAAMEVETCARMDIPVVVIVSNNGGIAGHSIQDRYFPPDGPPVGALMQPHYEKMVEMVGGYSERVEDPDDLSAAIDRALNADTIALLNVVTDPKAQRAGGGAGYLG
ncbi:MAG TPA: thiamine pyrophosphate-binding protein [Dehalococcoidia bacterium]|jgi:thiamine pyrophosphate-dependent acetolactate synthase large subunit-like protein|nr:thiamine pyrophosphate-binding protein [Dehalococcoidia bacterium]